MLTDSAWPVTSQPRIYKSSSEVEPDFLTMVEQQVAIVVTVTRTVADIVRGKESAHSLLLLDLEQRCEELWRRHAANLCSCEGLMNAGLPDIVATMEALKRVVVRLFRAARGCQQMHTVPDDLSCRMIGVIQQTIESLRCGYARLANSSPAAETDAARAIAGNEDLRDSAQGHGVRQTPIGGCCCGAALSPAAPAGQIPFAAPFGRGQLHSHLHEIGDELAQVGLILRQWSRRLSAAGHDGSSYETVNNWPPKSGLSIVG